MHISVSLLKLVFLDPAAGQGMRAPNFPAQVEPELAYVLHSRI
jgi:hypothetical protein